MSRTDLSAWQREPIRTLAVAALGPLATDLLEALAKPASIVDLAHELGSGRKVVHESLQALARRGLVVHCGQAVASGRRPSHVYALTPSGVALLEAMRSHGP